jgi:hypothetical protein
MKKELEEKLVFLTSNSDIPGCVQGRKSLLGSSRLMTLIENFKHAQKDLDTRRFQFSLGIITIDPVLLLVEEIKEAAFDIATFAMRCQPDLYKEIEKSLTGFVFACFDILRENRN